MTGPKNLRRTEGSPVQISDSSSVGAGEQERHTDREEVQKYFGLKLTPVETIPLPLPPCFRQWPVCADRRDGCRSPRGCGLLCCPPGTDPVPGGGSGPCSGENLLEKGFGAVYMDGPFPSDRAHVPGCSWADPFLRNAELCRRLRRRVAAVCSPDGRMKGMRAGCSGGLFLDLKGGLRGFFPLGPA